MKKIINKTALIILLSFSSFISCKNESKRKDTAQQTAQRTAVEPETLLAIGKVLPAAGWQQITTEGSGIIEKIFVKEGDTLNQGTRVLQIRSTMNELDLEQAQIKLQEMEDLQLQNKQDLIREEVVLDQLSKKYATSKLLYDQQAETKEVTELDYSNWKQQEAKVNSMKKLLSSQGKSQEEQKINIAKSKEQINNLLVSVTDSGILTELFVEPGQFINSADPIGTYGNLNKLIIEAELDELFSDRVQAGQIVSFRKLGQQEEIGQGKITYVSPTLSD
ncbi:efflux RND transporter periplasmic adaptor subunit [Sphingobacterium sp. HJSM2_6]|uniref:efflux RND transporter periplasmic adaptor subunit n=1 Tax=Sphingobacterium sp. HJSM2_6 TaxID=3366264 RepID=UPI003BE31583